MCKHTKEPYCQLCILEKHVYYSLTPEIYNLAYDLYISDVTKYTHEPIFKRADFKEIIVFEVYYNMAKTKLRTDKIKNIFSDVHP